MHLIRSFPGYVKASFFMMIYTALNYGRRQEWALIMVIVALVEGVSSTVPLDHRVFSSKRQPVRSIITSVLQDAKLLSSSTRGFRLFSKDGGLEQGSRDFMAFGIEHPLSLKHTLWGTTGDGTILLYRRDGAGVLDIRTLRSYHDGTRRWEIDTILYNDRLLTCTQMCFYMYTHDKAF